MTHFCKIAYNGKSIAEVREKEELKVQFQPSVSNCFFRGTKLLKLWNEKAIAGEFEETLFQEFSPAF